MQILRVDPVGLEDDDLGELLAVLQLVIVVVSGIALQHLLALVAKSEGWGDHGVSRLQVGEGDLEHLVLCRHS